MKRKNTYSPIISAKELGDKIADEKLVIVDASSGAEAYEDYRKQHLDGALFVGLDQLSDRRDTAADGGRHPLPSVEEFSRLLQHLGMTRNHHIVIYDHKNGSSAAARFWWMLRAVGHGRVQVLDGGFDAARKEGIDINDQIVEIEKMPPYEVDDWIMATATMEEVERYTEDDKYIIIDVRSQDRYDGISEPLDLIAGHIPGAINIPFETNLNSEGNFLSKDELSVKYGCIFDQVHTENIIVHCGSGVTACHTLLSMELAGFEIPKLYVGSWSEWSRNDKKMILKS